MSNNRNFYPASAFESLISEIAINTEKASRTTIDEKSLLEDLQANILKHHKRNYACHVFISFKKHKLNEAAQWIASLPLTDAQKQLDDRKKEETIKRDSIVCFYLSNEGYQYLGVPNLAPKKCCSFESGLIKKSGQGAEEKIIKDITKDFHVNDQDGLFYKSKELKKYHAMLLFADNDLEEFDKNLNAVLGALESFAVVEKQYALLNKSTVGNGKSEVKDWFGFKDGISSAQFFPDQNYPVPEKSIASLKSIVVKDPAGKYKNSSGSYMVFLKMRQDVQAYISLKDKIAAKTNDDRIAEAYIIGRFKNDNTPLTLTDGDMEVKTDDFNYKEVYQGKTDAKGIRCPFHAHIRRANPRNNSNYKDRTIHRRGIPYIGGINSAKDLIDILTDKKVFENTPDNLDLGLLFISFQASIEKQFEFIVTNWLHKKTNLGNGVKPGRDILTSKVYDNIEDKEKYYIPSHWNTSIANPDEQHVTRDQALVELLGGQYFFAPAISALERITKEALASEGDFIEINYNSGKKRKIKKAKIDKKTGALVVGLDRRNDNYNIKFERDTNKNIT